ncbi:Lon protease C-terminal proteolytic domain-containing protein [Chytriomyces sp. MP71]|nr:Lon protease C-terminal proteolytic domain-containing protein [Chytriomyces sp. MP71]
MPPNLSKTTTSTKPLAVLPMHDGRVLFPGIVLRMQVSAARDSKAVALLEHLMRQFRDASTTNSTSQAPLVACIPVLSEGETKRSAEERGEKDDAERDDVDKNPLLVDPRKLFGFGVAARIVSFRQVNNEKGRRPGRATASKAVYSIAIEGLYRIKIDAIQKADPFLQVHVSAFENPDVPDTKELAAFGAALVKIGLELTDLLAQLQLPSQVLSTLRKTIQEANASQLADLLASMIDLSLEEKLELLAESEGIAKRVEKCVELVGRQIQVLKISQKIQTNVENKLGKQQREYILRQQLEAIKKELGESDSDSGDSSTDPDLTALKKKLETMELPPEAAKSTKNELGRLKRMPATMPEHSIIRTYLEWMSEMPWIAKSGGDGVDVEKARLQLDSDHFGMAGVKRRVLEHLAVGKLKKDMKGPILCLIGPPGVGKTSLGQSIATALGRKFYRISLGGVRDEAEIRGHRRTYIGALPGLIIQAMRKCGVKDPVILLDEIDKLTRDARGDPSAALLEVLDPEQNSTFTDHYLNVPFDLSHVLFIATANDADTISPPLMDRMEVIQIPGYTFQEKLAIAQSYLLPKQVKAHGLPENIVNVPQETLLRVATDYTRESGVRTLNREVAAVCRFLAVEYARAVERHALDAFNGHVSPIRLVEILGQPKFVSEASERNSVPGVVTGLAWTSDGAGGLLFIEAMRMPGKGKLVLTGKLGDVIKESAQLGLSWVRANARRLRIPAALGAADILDGIDVHIHFPAGATPKDGPSAGIAIVTALVSLFLDRPVNNYLAMTGEMTLRGQVGPVGGIKEKVLAAHRGGVKRVLLPERNRKDVDEIPADVQKSIDICFVACIEEVLGLAFDEGVLGGVQVVFESKL